MSRTSTLFKDPASGIIHLASALAGVAGLCALLAVSPPGGSRRASLAVYGASLILLFTASAVYHLLRVPPRVELMLRRIDHSAIYLLIAGTYTPICVIVLPAPWGPSLLAAIWALAAIGVVLAVAFLGRTPRWLSTVMYVLMGWVIIVCIVPLSRVLPLGGFLWLIGGGIVYSAGAVVYATKRMDFLPGRFGFHEVWHLFVTGAAALHFVLIAGYVAPFAG